MSVTKNSVGTVLATRTIGHEGGSAKRRAGAVRDFGDYIADRG
jgi:hypothetical protein